MADILHPAAADLERHLHGLHKTAQRLFALGQPYSRAQIGLWAPHGAHPALPIVEATPHTSPTSAHQRLEWEGLLHDVHGHLQGVQNAQNALPALAGTGLCWFFLGTVMTDFARVQMHVERQTTHGAQAIDQAITGLCSLLGHLPAHHGHAFSWNKGETSFARIPAADPASAVLLVAAITHHGDWSRAAVEDTLQGRPTLVHHVPLSGDLRADLDSFLDTTIPLPA